MSIDHESGCRFKNWIWTGTLIILSTGWEYNGKGECIRMPSTAYVPGIKADTLDVRTSQGVIYVWVPAGMLSMPSHKAVMT